MNEPIVEGRPHLVIDGADRETVSDLIAEFLVAQLEAAAVVAGVERCPS